MFQDEEARDGASWKWLRNMFNTDKRETPRQKRESREISGTLDEVCSGSVGWESLRW